MNKTSNKPSHVFEVEVGMSGTKFMQSVLTFHPELHISTETHFFSSYLHNGFIKEAKKIGDLSIDKNIDLLVDKMFNNQIFGAFWRRNISKDKACILSRFKLSDRSFKSLFQIIIEDDLLGNNKTIKGEKTPSHLYHVDALLQLNISLDERMLNLPVRGSSFKTPEEIAISKKAKEYLFSKQFN